MQLNTAQSDVTTVGVNATRAFSIENDAMMFSILADKIYSDKPRAVVREIACNALDIHTQIGQSRPFLISLPTDDGVGEPMLVVRDFGTGLDDDGMSLFTTFGKSTKRASDSAVGGFGIGCKSPFAYTDAFTITSYQGGEKRTYCAFRAADGVPQLTDPEVTATDEPDGLEIRVPIKQADYYRFRNIASEVLRTFPEGSYSAFGFDVDPVEYSTRHTNYAIRTRAEHHGRSQVLMGPVAYNLDWSQVTGVEMPSAIVPIFEIGQLSLAPSREQLSYDPLTVQRLKDRFGEIAAGVYADMRAQVDAMPIWRKIQFVRNLDQRMKKICQAAETGSDLFGVPQFIELPGFASIIEQNRKRRGRGYNVETRRQDMVTRLTSSSLDSAYVIYDDLPVDMKQKRVAARVGNFSTQTAYVVDGDACTWDELVQLLDGLDASRLLKLSDLDPPMTETGRARAKRQKSSAVRVLRLTERGWIEHPDPVDGGVYVPLNNYDVDAIDLDVEQLRYSAWATGAQVFGMSKKARKQADMSRFERLDVYCARRHREALADPRLKAELNRRATAEAVEAEPGYQLLASLQRAPDVGTPDADVAELARCVADYANRGLGKAPKAKVDQKPLNQIRRILAKSPFLQLLVQANYSGTSSYVYLRGGFSANNPLISALI